MSDTQISGTTLPAFDRFRAGDVESTIRELLERSRGEVATLEAQPHPTFSNTVLPLEQLSHRLSRTWSPVSHLNGVLNSDELRASYNACLPLLSNYWTDLAQSEPLYRAYSAIASQRAARARRRAAPRARARARGLPARRRRPAEGAQGALQGGDAGARAARREVRGERARRHECLDAARDRRGRARRDQSGDRRAGARPRRGEGPRRLAVRARAAHLRGRHDRRGLRAAAARLLRGLVDARLGSRTVGRQVRQQRRSWRRSWRCATRPRSCSTSPTTPRTRSPRAWRRRTRRCSISCASSRAWRGRPRSANSPSSKPFAGRRLNAWDVGYYAEKLQHKLFSISQEELRPYFPLPRVLAGPVRGRRATVRREDRRAHRRAGVARRRALLRDPRRQRQGARRLLPRCLRAAEETRRRVDGRLRRPQGIRQRTHRAGGLPGVQLPAGRRRQAGAAHARRRRDDVPRVRPRPAPHADAGGLSVDRRHQRRVLGCGRAAEPVHGELRLASRRCSGRWRVTSRPASRCPRTSRRSCWARAPSRPASPPCASSNSRCSTSGCTPNTTPRRGARIDADPRRGARRGRRCSPCRTGIASRTTSRTSSRAAMPRATTATSGPRCSPPTRSRPSRSSGVFDRAVAQRFLDSILSQGGSRKALDAFVDFRGRPPDVNALLRQQGLGG